MNLTPTHHTALNTNSLPPAQLWVGDHATTVEKAKTWLQTLLCPQSGCLTCTVCRAVADEQHHSCMWLQPDNNYTLADLAPIFSTLSFALETEQHYFFIIKKADLLSAACSNSLLKSLEEPPRGYHFILLAQREEALLPTVRSRCITHTFYDAAHAEPHRLITLFSSSQPINPLLFLKELDQLKIQEQETFELIDQLLIFWMAQHKKTLSAQQLPEHKRAQHMITILKKALLMPPMPGSSNLFWKNLLLQVNNT